MWDRFLRACARQPVDRTPVWFMRQAGRYMPEYRALRERWGILDLIRTPELAVQVTLQPVNAFQPDAAIVFSDILPLLAGMGLELEYARGEGPVIHNPIRSAADVAALGGTGVGETTSFTIEAIRLAARELKGRTPIIGFAGAPFTLACYAVEGGSSLHHMRVKGLMREDPTAWTALMKRLAEASGLYLKAQAEAGAAALQVFDSWAGALAPQDYRQHVLPYTRRTVEIASEAGVPVILFSTGTAGFLEDMATAGASVMGVDWRVDLDIAWDRIGAGVALQGNLDPVALLAAWPSVRSSADDVLARAAGRVGHIFNLGHGILPDTSPDNVRRLVDHVHMATERVTA